MTRLSDRYTELVAQGWGPSFPVPVIELPVGDGAGTFFSWVSAGGVGLTLYDRPDLDAAYEVHGAILASYLVQGGPLGPLGYPISDEKDDVVGSAVVGRMNDFERGGIFWSQQTGQVSTMTLGPVSESVDIYDGIDVSAAQGPINWTKVVNGGTQFAYIKATEGVGTDQTFTANWTASRGLLPRGAYHVFRPTSTPEGARPQADHFAAVLASSGDGGELAPMVDVELALGKTVAQCVASLQFFLGILSQSVGRQPVIYTFPSFWEHQMGGSSLFAQSFRLWIASYGNPAGPKVGNQQPFSTRMNGPLIPPGWQDWTIWQHAVLAGVPGIGGLVDRDFVMTPSGVPLTDYLA